jgi:osmotically-inducible protein OsmY
MKPISTGVLLVLAACGLASCGTSTVVGTGAVITRTVLQERTTLAALQDTEIQLSLNNRFLNHSPELFDDISTSVVEGRVVLTGSVPTREEKIAATELAWSTPGVVTITDELTVQEDSSASAYVEDAWISNRIRLGLLTDTRISSVNYTIETVDKVVHLTGIARSSKELAAVIEHASAIPGVVHIVSHVLTIDDPRRQVTTAVAPATGRTG